MAARGGRGGNAGDSSGGYIDLPATAPSSSRYAPPDLGGAPRALSASALAIGLTAVPAAVDEGFVDASGRPVASFDPGLVEVRQGAPFLDLSALQQPLSAWGRAKSLAVITLTAATGVGLFYLAGKVTLVRQGQLAITRSVAGECRALESGWHLLDTVTCEVRIASMTDAVVQLGTLHVLRVFPGQLGLAQLNGHPTLLSPGVHLVNDPLFSFLGTEAMTKPHITIAGTCHIITVQRGEVGLCLADAVGHFLGPGKHAVNHPRFEFRGFAPASAEYINVGSKHRILMPAGRLGLAWQAGQPLLLEPNASTEPLCIDSTTFKFERSVSATMQVIRHGSLKVITVRQGFVGVSFADGRLDVLAPGLHRITSVTHAFAGFLPTGQQTLDVNKVTSMTSDNVGLEFDAAITVQVVDAVKAIITLSGTTGAAKKAAEGEDSLTFDSSTIWTAVCGKARLALSIIIGNQRLNRGDGTQEEDSHHPATTQPGRGGVPLVRGLGFAPAEARAAAGAAGTARPFASAPEADSDGKALSPDPVAPGPSNAAHSFRALVHDSFMASFAAHMVDECGVAVVEMSLEDVRVTDPTLAEAMARGAVARADLAKAGIDAKVKLTSAEADKSAQILTAEGKAKSISILAAAEANRVRVVDEALAATRSQLTQQREMLIAAGDVLRSSNATLVLAQSPADAAALLGSGSGGGGLPRLAAPRAQ